ncbi:MAG: NADH-quinone oxidoreductase subunit M [Phycisphaerales bacterium]|nr:NADH-quinone oxidoreductase subunit M [Phycisphaerales bacterium]
MTLVHFYGSSSILTCLILLPVIGSLMLLLVPSAKLRLIRWSALTVLVGMLAVAVAGACLFRWDMPVSHGVFQLQQKFLWIPALNMHYFVGVDNLSMPAVLLVTLLAFISGLASFGLSQESKTYYILLILTAGALIGALVSLDLLLLAVFLQIFTLSGYTVVSLLGGARRHTAGLKFNLFGFAGTLALLCGTLVISHNTRGLPGLPQGTMDIVTLTTHPQLLRILNAAAGSHIGAIVFWLLLTGFAIRLPGIILHLWLPEISVESPAPIAMLIMAGSLVAGGYGLLRVVYPLFSDQALIYRPLICEFAVIGVVYGGLCALAQTDIKRLIAYWLLSQASYVLLGIALMNALSIQGAILQLFGLAIATPLLLWVAHTIEQRAHHTDLSRLGGLAAQLPDLFRFSIIGFFAAMGAPGLSLFFGQVLILFGGFTAVSSGAAGSPGIAPWQHTGLLVLVIALAMAMVTAGYILWAMERIFMGPARPEFNHFIRLSFQERCVMLLPVMGIIALGIAPTIVVLTPMRPAIEQLLRAFAGAG